MATLLCSQGHHNPTDAVVCATCGEQLQQKKSGVPAWVIVLIVLGVGCLALPVISILAITFLGRSADSKFQSVGTEINTDFLLPVLGIRPLWALRRELLR